MKKIFLLITLLTLSILGGGSLRAQVQPTDEQYQAARSEITDGLYYISTESGGTTYYLVGSNGTATLTSDKSQATQFGIQQKSVSSKFKSVCWRIAEKDGYCFTNGPQYSTATTSLNIVKRTERDDYERQVIFKGDNGKFAVRCTNGKVSNETAWNSWAPNCYWATRTATIDEADMTVACYDNVNPGKGTFIWSFEKVGDANADFCTLFENAEATKQIFELSNFGYGPWTFNKGRSILINTNVCDGCSYDSEVGKYYNGSNCYLDKEGNYRIAPNNNVEYSIVMLYKNITGQANWFKVEIEVDNTNCYVEVGCKSYANRINCIAPSSDKNSKVFYVKLAANDQLTIHNDAYAITTTTGQYHKVKVTQVQASEVPADEPNQFDGTVETNYTKDITISGAVKYSTLYLPNATIIPVGVQAFCGTVNANGNSIHLNELQDVIPANTAVVLKAPEISENTRFIFSPTTMAVEGVNENCLKGSTADVTLDADKTYYVLGYIDEMVGFYRYTADAVPANKAYYEVEGTYNESSSVKSFLFSDDADATAIQQPTQVTTAEPIIYDMNGMRVNKNQKGIYIVNGKKVLY